MKKATILAAAAFVVASMTSCKKNYVCECKSATGNYTYDLGKIKKSDAKDACNAAGSLWLLAGGSCTASVK